MVAAPPLNLSDFANQNILAAAHPRIKREITPPMGRESGEKYLG